ncbi:MAG TPA: acyl carrier protein [Candidatus Macondimonas sp.]|nr:acyl carrier protein [Candidatus Macondimonas sp.]
MNRDEIQARLTEILATIAPEMEPATLDPMLDLREQLDIDSMDLLNFITAVHKRLGVNIPEADYPRLTSLAACVDYVVERRPSSRPKASFT